MVALHTDKPKLRHTIRAVHLANGFGSEHARLVQPTKASYRDWNGDRTQQMSLEEKPKHICQSRAWQKAEDGELAFNAFVHKVPPWRSLLWELGRALP